MSSRIFSCTSGWSITLIGATTGAGALPLAAGAALAAGTAFAAGAVFTASALAGAGLVAPFFWAAGFAKAGAEWPLVPFDFATGFFGSGALALLGAGAAFFSGFLGSR